MDFDKTLRWLDPYGKWGDHEGFYHKSKFLEDSFVPDTGLCNRLLHWENAYHITQQPSHKEYKILIQKRIWPELEIISLPNTYIVDYAKTFYQWQSYYKHDELHFKTVFDIKNDTVKLASPINKEKMIKLLSGNDILSDNAHWYSNFGFLTLGDFSFVKKRYINKIKLKHTEINDLIKEKYKEYVGIHIRRGNGVMYSDEDIMSLPEPLQKKYKKLRKTKAKVIHNSYKFIQDDFYYKIIKELLLKNPSQKFYISHDLPDEFINQYYKKFGHHVIESKYNNRYFFEHYYANAGVDVVHLKNYSNAIDNVIDLFTLANCGMVIGLQSSTWSEFAKDYSEKPYCNNMNTIKEIVNEHSKLNFSLKSAI
jgi:hypothetical protein